jgi:predicted aspartyl protease
MVDTGFSGFLSLPILKAFPLGLILQGTMGITLADGSTHARLTARGQVSFDGKKQIGLILLEWQNTDILVGMDFLTKFGKRMILCAVNRTVEIVDSEKMEGPATAPAAPEIPKAIPLGGTDPPKSP